MQSVIFVPEYFDIHSSPKEVNLCLPFIEEVDRLPDSHFVAMFLDALINPRLTFIPETLNDHKKELYEAKSMPLFIKSDRYAEYVSLRLQHAFNFFISEHKTKNAPPYSVFLGSDHERYKLLLDALDERVKVTQNPLYYYVNGNKEDTKKNIWNVAKHEKAHADAMQDVGMPAWSSYFMYEALFDGISYDGVSPQLGHLFMTFNAPKSFYRDWKVLKADLLKGILAPGDNELTDIAQAELLKGNKYPHIHRAILSYKDDKIGKIIGRLSRH